MDHGADPFILSNLGANILHAAAESKAISGLECGLDVWRRYPQQLNINQANRWLETPLHVASWSSPDCVKKLLEAGADHNARQEDQQTPLHCAGLMQKGEARRKIVALLCGSEGELDIDAQDVDGRPPIYEFLNDPLCVQILLEHGASLDLLDNTGRSAFHQACILGETDTLKLLIARSTPTLATAAIRDHSGDTTLIHALRHGSVECAMALLALNDIEDAKSQDGWTAIHFAAKLGDPDVLEAVLQHPNLKKGNNTYDGKTAEVVAMDAGNWDGKVKTLLRKHNSII